MHFYSIKTWAVVCLVVACISISNNELRAQCSDLAVSCFVVGPSDVDILASDGVTIFRDKDTFVSVPYLSSGRPGDPTYTAPSLLARHRDTGTVFGVGEQAQNNAFIFVSSFTKRAAGYGPLGAGGIYRVDPTGTPPANVTPWATVPNAVAAPHNFAANGDHLTFLYDDAVTKDHIGKTSLGDLEMSLDGFRLFTVNLGNKHLYGMPAVGAAPVAVTDLGLIPNPVGCEAADFQPFALGIHPVSGLLYIGATCTNESLTSTDGLHGYVLTYSGSFSNVFNFELDNYNFQDPAIPWSGWSAGAGHQPLFVDIEFLGDDLVFGIRDRVYDWRYVPNASAHAHGDVLRACKAGATWVLESGGSCGGVAGSGQIYGPGAGEFLMTKAMS